MNKIKEITELVNKTQKEKQKEIVLTENDLLQKATLTYFKTLTEELTEVEQEEFYMLCLLHKLNPLKKEIYAIKYGTKFNIIVSFEVYRKRADATGLLEYYNTSITYKNIKNRDGEITNRTPQTARFEGKRKDRTQPTIVEIEFSEFNLGKSVWKEKPTYMIKKVVESLGLRQMFPNEIGNMPYTQEQVWFNDKDNNEAIKENIKIEEQVDLEKLKGK